MARTRAIHQAVSEILREAHSPMSPEQIYHAIVNHKLYTFPAKDPISVVRTTLRRHCVNLDFPSARLTKYFSVDYDGRYSLLPAPVTVEPNAFKVTTKGRRTTERIVSVPSDDASLDTGLESRDDKHTEIQWKLLDLGIRLGMSVWAPHNDRNRCWKGQRVGDMHGLLDKLPPQFEPAAMRIVSFIDVIWLEKRTMFAAFEVEHTTPIYSGLLRMADLMTLVPNQDLKWYIVSAEDRFDRFASQVTRPVFQEALKKPLHSVCKFLSYKRLLDRIDEAHNVLDDLKPSFLDRIAESYDPADAFQD